MSGSAEAQADRRLTALRSTRKRVHATELYTLAMLPRLRARAEDAVSYYGQVLASLDHIGDTAELHQLMAGIGDEGRTLYLVITSPRGMCGPYNRHVLNELDRFAAGTPGAGFEDADFVALGAKGRAHIERRGGHVVLAVDKGLEDITLEETADLAGWALSRARAGYYRQVFVVYTRYLDAVHSEPTTMTLLPIGGRDGVEDRTGDPSSGGSIVDFEGEAAALVSHLVDSYVVGMLYSLLRYSVAAEYSERRLAMQQAMKGIDDEIAAARGQQRRAALQRQTNALLEIINNQGPAGSRRRRRAV